MFRLGEQSELKGEFVKGLSEPQVPAITAEQTADIVRKVGELLLVSRLGGAVKDRVASVGDKILGLITPGFPRF